MIPSQPSDKLMNNELADAVERIGANIYAATGLRSDAQFLTRVSRQVVTRFQETLGSPPTVVSVAKRVGDVQHEATLQGDRRPLGAHALFFGFTRRRGPQLFSTSPSGTHIV
jgi:20S proteasome alpha/beta subunit